MIEFKQKIVESFGGKCNICGCIDYYEVYDIHHLDSESKNKEISKYYTSNGRRLSNISFNVLIKELEKCVMLCSNCHRKLHRNHTKLIYKKTFDAEVLIKEFCDICPVCGNGKLKKYKNCSNKCRYKSRRIVKRPTRNILKKEIEEHSYSYLGRKYNVNYNTIKKWAIFYDIELKKRL